MARVKSSEEDVYYRNDSMKSVIDIVSKVCFDFWGGLGEPYKVA